MNLLNRYFTPFAALLILSAILFSGPDRLTIVLSVGVWGLSVFFNWWLAKNTYRFVGWTGRLKTLQVWLNYIWTLPLFYLLHGFWYPMWLLFVMAPVTSALYQAQWQTLSTALISAFSMLGLYWLRSHQVGLDLGPMVWGMAMIQAVFIVIFSLFIHALAETALRLRDAASR